MNKPKIVIVAAGLATRLRPLTNFIPKVLVNIGKETGLVAMTNYWKDYSTDFTIIVHSTYAPLVKAYWDLYFKDAGLTLEIVQCDKVIGTRETIMQYTPARLNGDEVLFTWCDIVPTQPLNIIAMQANDITVFLHGKESRYKFEAWCGKLVEEDGGDVVGIYHFNKFNGAKLAGGEGTDLADTIHQAGSLSSYYLDGLIDFGDQVKLDRLLSIQDGAREFNELIPVKLPLYELIYKRARTLQGRPLIEREIKWYNKLAQYPALTSIPKVFVPATGHGDGFFIEKIPGTNLFQAFNKLSEQSRQAQLTAILDQLDELHEVCKKPTHWGMINGVVTAGSISVSADIEYEAKTKLHTRLGEIKEVIACFGLPKIVNGLEVDDVSRVIDTVHARLQRYHQHARYSLIHGDPQFSNIMLTPENQLKFIDPRGYFGGTELYGLPEYDYAKVLYSLSGYDHFNTSTSFYLEKADNGVVQFTMPHPELDVDFVRDKFRDKFDSTVYYDWLIVIWLGLAQYIKNNPVKSYAALCHGLYLAAKSQAGQEDYK